VCIKLAVIAGLFFSPERPETVAPVAVNGSTAKQPVNPSEQRFGLAVGAAEAAEPAKDQSKDQPKDGSKDAGKAPAGKADPNDGQGSKRDQQKKGDELDRKEQSLRELEKDLDAKLVRLQELDAKLQRMLDDANAMKDQKLRHLIDVYTNMKAKQAATVLETLDEKIAVKILAGMRGKQAGEILTFMQAEKAAKLSEQLTKMQVPFQ